MQLYRPVGLIELQRIYERGMRAFPPRLPEQPIFYPVLNQAYAVQIARDWNTKSHSFAGYVTEFVVDDQYALQFKPQIVGNRTHGELWVPADQLAAFNQHIEGVIKVSAAYFGAAFRGYVPAHAAMKGRDAVEQFVLLAGLFASRGMDFHGAITANHVEIYLHYPFWKQYEFTDRVSVEQKHEVLAAIATVWQQAFPRVALLNVP